MRDVIIHVCTTCRRPDDDPAAPRPGARLAAALEARVGAGMTLAPVECLGDCKRPCTVAFSASGTWTYVFGDLDPAMADDVVSAAALLAGSADGLMPWRPRPEPFKRGMIARVPPNPLTNLMKEAAE